MEVQPSEFPIFECFPLKRQVTEMTYLTYMCYVAYTNLKGNKKHITNLMLQNITTFLLNNRM